jgi:hypothetical protein
MAKWQGNMPEWMRKEMQVEYDKLKAVNPAIVRGALKRKFGETNADEFLRNSAHYMSQAFDSPAPAADRRSRLHRALDAVMDAGYPEPHKPHKFSPTPGHLGWPSLPDRCQHCGEPKSDDRHDVIKAVKVKDAEGKLEVRQGRSGNWAVFKSGSDYPEGAWYKSKSGAQLSMPGKHERAAKSEEAIAREHAKRTELNPVVRNYFKLDK